MGGRKERDIQNISTSFIHLLCARHWEFKDEQNRVPISEGVTKTVPIFEDLLKIKTTLANVLLGTEFLSLNKNQAFIIMPRQTISYKWSQAGSILTL